MGGAEQPPRGFGPVEIGETLNAVKCPGWPRQSVRWLRRVRAICYVLFHGVGLPRCMCMFIIRGCTSDVLRLLDFSLENKQEKINQI